METANKIVIKKHNFELAKNRIKEFSEKHEKELAIDTVRTDGGLFGLGDHKVTGYEFNNRLETIQKHLIDLYANNNKTIKEFREIYNAFDSLDKDYINSIVTSVKAIEKTSNDVRSQQKTIKKQQGKLDAHQADIDKIVCKIEKTVKVLFSFKKKIDKFEHLTDIDKIWLDCEKIRKEIRDTYDSLSISIKATEDNTQANLKKVENLESALVIAENKIKDLSKRSYDLCEKLKPIDDFTISLKQITHLQDADEIWKQTKDQQLRIEKLEQDDKKHTNKIAALEQADNSLLQHINLNEENINGLNKYIDKLSGISHLEDIDSIWKSVEEHAIQLAESVETDKELAAHIQKNKNETDKEIADEVQKATNAVRTLTKRIKYAYWIAGGSAGLAVVELILLLMRVI